MSGEALGGDKGFGIDSSTLAGMAAIVKEAFLAGAQIGMVIGGGNIFRGVDASACKDRVSADYMGMLATVMNAIAFKEALLEINVPAIVMSAIEMPKVAEIFSRDKAVESISKGKVVIFAAGTGCPFFTTDTTAALRALEIGAQVLIKATKVNGVYDRDPVKFKDAVFFPEIDYDQAINMNLGVMDLTAVTLCRDNDLEIRVINIREPENLKRLLKGEAVGSIVRGRKCA